MGRESHIVRISWSWRALAVFVPGLEKGKFLVWRVVIHSRQYHLKSGWRSKNEKSFFVKLTHWWWNHLLHLSHAITCWSQSCLPQTQFMTVEVVEMWEVCEATREDWEALLLSCFTLVTLFFRTTLSSDEEDSCLQSFLEIDFETLADGAVSFWGWLL